MSFLKDNSRFCGTGEKNRNGESLEEFLAGYDPKKYDNPSNTTDIVVTLIICRRLGGVNSGMPNAPPDFCGMAGALAAGA